MELRLLRYFVAVAEELNITRAAERLHTAQPSLSQQIRQLEGLIGAPLFIRDKHRLLHTETGRVLLPAAKEILALVDRAVEQARATAHQEVSSLVVGMVPGPEGMIFSRILPLLLQHSPAIQLTLRTLTCPEQIQALQRREIMAGFLRGPIDCAEIAHEVYMREEVLALVPERWPISRLGRLPVRELAKLPMIAMSAAIAPAVHQVAETIAQRAGVSFRTGFCSESLMTSMNAVASGLGFCFFSSYVADLLPKGVVALPLDLDPVPTLDLLFAYRKDDRLPALATLAALVHEHSPFLKQHCSPLEPVRPVRVARRALADRIA